MGKKLKIGSHELVPKHVKLSETEAKKLFERYSITSKELPKISKNDSAIDDLDPKAGEVIKIMRDSETAGETVYYREVVDE